jgi:hypothetical protein
VICEDMLPCVPLTPSIFAKLGPNCRIYQGHGGLVRLNVEKTNRSSVWRQLDYCEWKILQGRRLIVQSSDEAHTFSSDNIGDESKTVSAT